VTEPTSVSAEPNDDKVLIARSIGTDRIELVEHGDGTIRILLNHRAVEGLRWWASGVESGVRTFLGMEKT